MPTDANKIYTPYLYGEEVAITTYPDDIQYPNDTKYNVLECERPYSQIYAESNLWYARHGGLDMAGRWHMPLYAVENATVVDAVNWHDQTGAWGSEGSGTYVALSVDGCVGHEVVCIYKHLSSKAVNKGDHVDKGSFIGNQGTTGNSTGEHLHFELWIDGTLRDPIPYVEDRKSFIVSDVTDCEAQITYLNGVIAYKDNEIAELGAQIGALSAQTLMLQGRIDRAKAELG